MQLAVVLCAILRLSCSYPSDSGQRDLVELDRVWQYMKAYSLYQSHVPSRQQALQFSDPYSLLDTIPDTLYSYQEDTTIRLAGYAPNCWGPGGIGKALSKGSRTAELVQKGSVWFALLTPGIAYMRIDSFVYEERTDNKTQLHIQQFNTEIANVNNLILDLAVNPGGSLDACTASIELFLPAGKQYLNTTYRKAVQTTGDTGTVANEIWTSRRDLDKWENKNIVVIISGNTASAAEIMAIALRDALGAGSVRLLGQRSYGKAIGQYTFCFWRTSSAYLQLTGFRFYSIAGQAYDYHEKGIAPDDSVAGSYVNFIYAAGEKFMPGFSTSVDTSLVNSLYGTKAAAIPRMIPRCYRSIPEAEHPLF